jgi:hypothetical protein
MPKRTNPFQKLITVIEKQLAGNGVVVTESKMLTEGEVDILIEGSVSSYAIKIAIECRDHRRKQDKCWIEQIIGKYAGQPPPVNQVVAVSNSGFTKKAVALAKQHGITVLSLKEAAAADWIGIVKGLSVRLSDVEFALKAVFVGDVRFVIGQKELEKTIIIINGNRDGNYTSIFRNYIGTHEGQEWYLKNVIQPGIASPERRLVTRLVLSLPQRTELVLGDVVVMDNVQSIEYEVHFKVAVQVHSLKAAEYGSNQVAHLTATWGGNEVVVGAVRDNERPGTIKLGVATKASKDLFVPFVDFGSDNITPLEKQ